MEVQLCAEGTIPRLEMPKDPQAQMIIRQRDFQKLVGTWDDKITALVEGVTYVRPDKVLHSLDMAVQECAEAWDQVEGGWKHHKRNPRAPNVNEVLMEMVDVLMFSYNAYLFMGGEPDRELVALFINRGLGKRLLSASRIGLSESWDSLDHDFGAGLPTINAMYGHGRGAHGDEWSKRVATFINLARSKIGAAAWTIRAGLASLPREQRMPDKFPAGPGFVFLECVQPVYAVIRAMECSQEQLYDAFCAKNEINLARQARGY